MSSPKTPASTIARWLRDNGMLLGGLTGTDFAALKAAVEIINLYSFDKQTNTVLAFGDVVRRMQPQLRYLAYHAIAHVGDWDWRERLWTEAGLDPLTSIPPCKFEPSARAVLTAA